VVFQGGNMALGDTFYLEQFFGRCLKNILGCFKKI
jgi:hypothetical protein